MLAEIDKLQIFPVTNILFRFLDVFSLIGTLKVMKLIADFHKDKTGMLIVFSVTFCFMVHFLILYQMTGIFHSTVDFQNDKF